MNKEMIISSNGHETRVAILEDDQLAELFVELHPGARVRLEPLPQERQAIDIGDSWCNVSLARSLTGWTPRTPLQDGLRRTLEFYYDHAEKYGVAARRVPGPVTTGRIAPA